MFQDEQIGWLTCELQCLAKNISHVKVCRLEAPVTSFSASSLTQLLFHSGIGVEMIALCFFLSKETTIHSDTKCGNERGTFGCLTSHLNLSCSF
jgi:hypothetical protein